MEKSKAGQVSPRAVLFDAYGTLFDVYSVGLLAEQLFPGQGQALALTDNATERGFLRRRLAEVSR